MAERERQRDQTERELHPQDQQHSDIHHGGGLPDTCIEQPAMQQ